MNYKNHLLSTAILSAAFCYLMGFDLTSSAIFISLATIASLLPDFDLPHSKISSIIFPIAIVVVCLVVVYFLGLTAKAIFFIIGTLLVLGIIYNSIMKHRGFTHTPFFALMAALPFLFFGVLEAGAVAFGILAHLLEDKLCDATGIGKGTWR